MRLLKPVLFFWMALWSCASLPESSPNALEQLPAAAGAGSATPRPQMVSGNEEFRRRDPKIEPKVICRDLQAPSSAPAFLTFKIQGPARIADLQIQGSDPRYFGYGFPEKDTYGPYKGEEVTDAKSPWKGANDYKVTDFFHLFLPDLRGSISEKSLARDRDPSSQNGVAEVELHELRSLSLIRLRCVAL